MKEKIERIKRAIIEAGINSKYIDNMNEIQEYIEALEKKLSEMPEAALEECETEMIPYAIHIEHADIFFGTKKNPPHSTEE